MIDVLFFGRIADIMRKRSLKVEVNDTTPSLFALRDQLFQGVFGTGRITSNLVQMSVNQAMTRDDRALQDGDEVAFFSVFSGG